MRLLRCIIISVAVILFTHCSSSRDEIVYNAKRCETPIAIDGNADAQWDAIPFAHLGHVCLGGKNITSPKDLSISFKTMWDRDYLYFLYDVTDDVKFDVRKLEHPLDRPLVYLLDCIEIFLTKPDRSTAYFGVIYGDGLNIPNQTVQYAQIDTPDGYVMEIAIPWTMLGLTPEETKKLRFETSAIDNDNRAEDEVFLLTQRSVIAWSPYDNATAWEDPSVFGNLILID